MQTKYVKVSGHAAYIFYQGRTTLPDVMPDFSRGRRIVMVHGAGGNGHTFHRQIAALSESHSPVALDLPGHGRSAGVEGFSSVSDYADFVAAFIEAIGMKSAIVLGHSMGGAIAMDLALRHPARVDAIILSATAGKFSITDEGIEPFKKVAMGRTPQQFNTDGYSPATVKNNFDVIREGWMEQVKTDPRIRHTDLLACRKFDLRDRIAEISKPALIIAGADDKLATSADAELMASKIPGAQLKIIADAGHYAPREKPAEYLGAITEFISALK